jgi:uncharacterized repeat protein (TIGR03806 family)
MRSFLIALLVTMLATMLATTLSAATIPDGFEQVQIASGLDPTTMTFAPDGRLFVCEKAGRIWVIKNNARLSTPFVDLRSKTNNENERGVQSVCFDPDFATNHYVYVYYCSTTPAIHNRVSRFTANGDVASGAETVIFDVTNLSSAGNHNGGGMRFGRDGKLYVSTGENASGPNAQNSGNLLGKLLRINANGTIPTDNPYYSTLSGNNRAIVAFGLRNPFTLAVQRTSGLLFINDVGSAYEEINSYNTAVAPVKTNFGWSTISGKRTSQTAPANYRDPVLAYQNAVYGTAICGGDFYNPAAPVAGVFPGSYTGKYFFCDYGKSWIKYIDPASPGTIRDFATGIARPIDIEVAADGSLWYIARGTQLSGGNTRTADGAVWRVRYTGAVQVATKLAFSQQPTAVGAGSPITPAVKVIIQDSSSATVTGSNATVTIAIGTNPGSAALSGTLSAAAVNGVATFSNLSLSTAGTGYTLRVTSGSLTTATSVAFNVNGAVATPTISPGTATFSGPVWAQLATTTSGATIHYTVNGTTPTGSSTTYSAPFKLSATTTVKAIALKSGLTTSGVASATFTISGSTAYGLDYRPPLTGVAMPVNVNGSLPATLSATGLFSNTAALTAKAGMIPYTVNSPLWSDNAQKQRWIGLPGSAKIIFAPNGEYSFPGGTVLVKHFDLKINENTNAMRRLETRVLVLDASGDNGYGVTYKWRSDNTNADLVADGGQSENITITTNNGTRVQNWRFPSRNECLACHTQNAGFVLGPKTRQLNGTYAYPGGGTDNQLRTWNYLGMFSSNIGESSIAGLHKMVKVDNSSATLETRVRSYLDANCAMCHRPGGTNAAWDARFDTAMDNQNIIHGTVLNNLSVSGAQVVVPRDLAKSVMHLRMNSTDNTRQMPPLARNLIDTTAVGVLDQWIDSLPNGTGLTGEYRTNQVKTFTGSPTVTRIDPTVNFSWSGAPATGVSSDNFTTRWIGTVVPAYTEAYTFYTETDDGVKLWVNNELIIDKWLPQSPTEWPASKTLTLNAGQAYTIKMEYFEGTSGATAKLRWSSASTPKGIIPMYRLLPSGVIVNPDTLFATKINFQPAASPTVNGYAVDSGLVYGGRGNGLTYGWSSDITTTARDRSVSSDQRRDTLVHMQQAVAPNAKWEIAVPNGTYEVFLVCGDAADNFNSTYRVNVENALAVSGVPTTSTHFFDSGLSFRVTVSDGKLTVSNGTGASNNKITYIEIAQVPGGNG